MQFFFLLLAPILVPALDIFPRSAVIYIFIGSVFSFYLITRRKSKFSAEPVRWATLWLFVSLMCIGFSCLGLSLDLSYGSINIEKALSYVLRVTLIYVVFIFFFALIDGKFSSLEEQLKDFTHVLFFILLFSAIFEYFCKFLSLNSILYFYKARQDLGGVDTLHYNRLSGFFSYPGDIAAVIVLNIVLVRQFVEKRKLVMSVVLFVLLLLTQSKAGLILLFMFYTITFITRIDIKAIVSFCLIIAVTFFIFSYFGNYFEYYLQFFNNLEFYLSASKRAQEIISFLKLDIVSAMFGNSHLHKTYESEIFGSLNRVGIIGSFWFFSITFCLVINQKTFRGHRDVFIFLLLFLTIYCTISAGFGRIKILVPFLIVFIYFMIYTTERTIDLGQSKP